MTSPDFYNPFRYFYEVVRAIFSSFPKLVIFSLCVSSISSLNFLTNSSRYTLRNVARCWTYETSVLVDTDIANDLPMTEYYEYFSPDYKLHPETSSRQENVNSKQYLELIVKHTYDNLKMIQHSPSVQMQDVPGDLLPNTEAEMMDDLDPDIRISQLEDDKKIDPPNEFYEDEIDQDKTSETEHVT